MHVDIIYIFKKMQAIFWAGLKPAGISNQIVINVFSVPYMQYRDNFF